MTQFNLAHNHIVVEKRKKRLIVLMMLDTDSLNELNANAASDTAALRHFLSQYKYINYTAEDWLDRLLYSLPVHGLLQRDDNPDDDVPLLQCN